MEIKKGELVLVNDKRKGKYEAISKEDFDTDKVEFYPLILNSESGVPAQDSSL